MRYLLVVAFASTIAIAVGARARSQPAPGSQTSESTGAVAAVGNSDESLSQQLDRERKTQRKRDTFLGIVAAGLAAFGSSYTLMKHRPKPE